MSKHLRVCLGMALTVCLLLLPALADVFVPPAERLAEVRAALLRELEAHPRDSWENVVRKQLADLPQKRLELAALIEKSEKAERAGERVFPSYMLAKGYQHLDDQEEVLKEWLRERPDQESSPTKDSLLPSFPNGIPFSAPALVALTLMALGALLGLRRSVIGEGSWD